MILLLNDIFTPLNAELNDSQVTKCTYSEADTTASKQL
jgi:hypothetical protein